jgi:hypothetical protein
MTNKIINYLYIGLCTLLIIYIILCLSEHTIEPFITQYNNCTTHNRLYYINMTLSPSGINNYILSTNCNKQIMQVFSTWKNTLDFTVQYHDTINNNNIHVKYKNNMFEYTIGNKLYNIKYNPDTDTIKISIFDKEYDTKSHIYFKNNTFTITAHKKPLAIIQEDTENDIKYNKYDLTLNKISSSFNLELFFISFIIRTEIYKQRID